MSNLEFSFDVSLGCLLSDDQSRKIGVIKECIEAIDLLLTPIFEGVG
jgi:hypothetical protein